MLRSQKTEVIELALAAHLLDHAAELQVDIDQACEAGLRTAVERAWLEQNRPALDSSNEWVEKSGIPAAEFRQF